MEKRNIQFQHNLGILSETDFFNIQTTQLVIVGLGGLGGHIANNMVRLGIEHFTLIDFDNFDHSNLNRQLFSNHFTLGSSKVQVIRDELLKINPNCTIITHPTNVEKLDDRIFKNANYIIDAVDSPQTKIYLSDLCTKLNIPLLHGACAGWYGQVGWITPGCQLLHKTYHNTPSGLEENLFNPSFLPSAIASIMTSEFVKYIQHSTETVVDQLLLIDLYNNTTIKTGDHHG